MKKHPTSFRLREDVLEKLDELAAAEDRSRANMLKHLVEAAHNRMIRGMDRESQTERRRRDRIIIGPDRTGQIGNEYEDGE